MFQLTSALVFILQTLVGLYLLVILLRFVLQLVRANFYNALSQFIVRATQPLLKPMRRVIPSLWGLDMSSLLLAIIVQLVLMAVVLLLVYGTTGNPVSLFLWALFGIVSLLLKIFYGAMIISVIISWVAPDSRSPIAELSYQISEPVLAPFRRIVPNLGGLDISPILAFLLISCIQQYVLPPIAVAIGMPPVLYQLI